MLSNPLTFLRLPLYSCCCCWACTLWLLGHKGCCCCCICACCCRIASSSCVASMASRDCRSNQLRYQVMFVFSCATIHTCSTRSDRSRSQVHCLKEGCIVQQGMWEVSTVWRGWSVDVLCQQSRMEGKLGDVRVGCGLARSQKPAAVMAMAVAVGGNKE